MKIIHLDPQNIRTTQRIVGYCSGTKEQEVCYCKGDRSRCDFYDYIREQAQRETTEYKINEATKFLENNGFKVIKLPMSCGFCPLKQFVDGEDRCYDETVMTKYQKRPYNCPFDTETY